MGRLASADEYSESDRCEGSVFEALESKELVEFSDGQFILDEDLMLAFQFLGYSEEGEERWKDLASGQIKSSWDLA